MSSQCERMVPHSNSWGKWKKRCAKEAIPEPAHNGQLLCVSCRRKLNKKLQRDITFRRLKNE